MRRVRLATRRSELAMAQARVVAELLTARFDGLEAEVVGVSSSGDRDHRSPVARLTEVGAFVRSLQVAVLEGRADAAVHSCKDLPTAGLDGLVVAAYPERAAPWDVLVGSTLGLLPPGGLVGTGSPRRAAQLRLLREDLRTAELRGNVPTRLRKVERGQVDAAVLAEAGLARLGREEEIRQRFSVEEMVPAPAQGTLAVEARAGSAAHELLSGIDDPRVRSVVETERRLLAETGAGCRAALGALATLVGERIRMTAFVEDERGPRRAVVEEGDAESVVKAAREELGL